MHDDARAPVGAGDNDENDDINDYDNYGVVQTGLFGQLAGRQVYKCTGDISGALVYRAGAKAFVTASLPLCQLLLLFTQQNHLKRGTTLCRIDCFDPLPVQ